MTRYLNDPRRDAESRLEPLYDVVEHAATAWDNETNPNWKSDLAHLLAITHKALHKLIKPDELAEGRAVATARKIDPAADQNAQSIVIHPLHRKGAPGVDAPKSATAGRGANPVAKEGAE